MVSSWTIKKFGSKLRAFLKETLCVLTEDGLLYGLHGKKQHGDWSTVLWKENAKQDQMLIRETELEVNFFVYVQRVPYNNELECQYRCHYHNYSYMVKLKCCIQEYSSVDFARTGGYFAWNLLPIRQLFVGQTFRIRYLSYRASKSGCAVDIDRQVFQSRKTCAFVKTTKIIFEWAYKDISFAQVINVSDSLMHYIVWQDKNFLKIVTFKFLVRFLIGIEWFLQLQFKMPIYISCYVEICEKHVWYEFDFSTKSLLRFCLMRKRRFFALANLIA